MVHVVNQPLCAQQIHLEEVETNSRGSQAFWLVGDAE